MKSHDFHDERLPSTFSFFASLENEKCSQSSLLFILSFPSPLLKMRDKKEETLRRRGKIIGRVKKGGKNELGLRFEIISRVQSCKNNNNRNQYI